MKNVDTALQSAHGAVDKIADMTNQAVEAFGDKGKELQNAEKQLVADCRGYVRDNPVTSLGIAVAAGFLLSRLLSSR